MPVALPPGRANDVTNPDPTGSATREKVRRGGLVPRGCGTVSGTLSRRDDWASSGFLPAVEREPAQTAAVQGIDSPAPIDDRRTQGHRSGIACGTAGEQPLERVRVRLRIIVGQPEPLRAALASQSGAWIVGGALRDALLSDRQIADLDLVVSGPRAADAARAVANAAHYGNNARIAPLASLQDGVLDVVVVDEVSIVQAAALLPRLFRGTIDKSKHVTIVQGKRVEIHRPSAGAAHLDGEPLSLPARLSVEIVPRSLRVLVPDTMERI